MASEIEVPAAAESLAWGTSPVLYLSYGMVTSRGVRPAQTGAVAAAPSFTVLSPPMGLDYFAVFDGHRHLGAATTATAGVRLLERLGDAIAGQVHGELLSANPRFAGMSHDVARWWRTVLQEAYHAVDVLVASSVGEGVSATALVALVLENYVVVANSGGSKAVLCRGGEHVELTHHENRMQRPSGYVLPDRLSCMHAPRRRCLALTWLLSGSATSSVDEEVVVDVVTVAWDARDEFLILGGGEFWSGVTPASACAFVRRRLAGTTSRITWGSPAFALELARLAGCAGRHRNVSVAVILLKNLWARPVSRFTTKQAKRSAAEAGH
ncbi:hypothetical protein BS78_03G014700 [Paspalum vaginatum]|nr:hypothetical protein BS78_03G014700 [Paspalum vaginatum]